MEPEARRVLREFVVANVRVKGAEIDADACVDRFEAYLALLRRAGRAMNLIGPLSDRAVVQQLFCDSLAPCTLGVDLGSSLVDVGSGAGIPGIPLALVDDAWSVTLIEPRDRRFRFLGMASRGLKLDRVRRVRGRVESADDLRALGVEAPATAISKAVFSPEVWIGLGASLVRPGGLVVAMLAADDLDGTRARAAELGLAEVAAREFRWRDAVPRWCLALRTTLEAQ